MSEPFLAPVVRRLREMGRRPAMDQSSDQDLLQRLVRGRDRDATQAIVARHAGTVRGVCQRVLGPGPDADDAFQATLLALRSKASSIRKQASLGSWLYGVAWRIAQRLKTRKCSPPPRDAAGPAPDPSVETAWRELCAVVDEEVCRLPEKYRAPIVACYFDGLTRERAAAQLGVPLRTLARRLEQARELLQKRLTQRGVSLSAGLLAGWLGQASSRAAVPPGAVTRAAEAVLALASGTRSAVSPEALVLAEGVRLGISFGKCKLGIVVVTAVCLVAGGYLVARQALGGTAGAPPVQGHGPSKVQSAAPTSSGSQARVDRYGDPLPPGAVARLGTVRFHYQDIILFLDISRDGRFVAAAGGLPSSLPGLKTAIRIWDRHTGKEIRSIQGPKTNVSVAFSPDGKLLASAGGLNEPVARLWDVRSGKLVDTLHGYEKAATRAVFSPDGKELATEGDGDVIRLWDMPRGHGRRRGLSLMLSRTPRQGEHAWPPARRCTARLTSPENEPRCPSLADTHVGTREESRSKVLDTPARE